MNEMDRMVPNLRCCYLETNANWNFLLRRWNPV
jgi:hypothetical protein